MIHDIRFNDVSNRDGIKDEGNMILALLGGLVAALISACLWVEFTALTGMNIGYLAAAVAGLVGISVRFFGGGTIWIFGVVGGLFTLVGALAGQAGAAIMMTTTNKTDFYGVMTHIDLVQMESILIQKGTVLIYVIYAVALLGAYRISIHKEQKLR